MEAAAALPALHLAPRAAAGDCGALQRCIAQARASLAAFLGGDATAAAEGFFWLRDAAARAPMPARARGAALAEAAWRCGADSAAADAALRALCASRPADVAALLAAAPGAWERCFRAGTDGARRAAAWFGAFSADGKHGRGAAALQRYLLQRRDTAWQLAAWRGPHPQAPGVVAAKPGLLCELDVPRTLAALPPDFWASADVADSLRDGALVALDAAFCLAELRASWRRGSDAERTSLRSALAAALADEPPRRACHALLPAVAPDAELLRAVRHWMPRGDEDAALRGTTRTAEPGIALAAAPFARVAWRSVADACLAAALARPGASGGIEATVAERAATGAPLALAAAAALEALLREADAGDAAPDGGGAAHAALLAAASNAASPEEGRLIILLAARALRTRLHRLARRDDVAEALLRSAGIAFRAEPLPEEARYESSAKRKHKSKSKRKHKHRRSRSRDSDGHASDDSEASALASAPSTWRCALDGFAMPRDAAATADMLADAAADAWLRQAQALADARREQRP
jgi:hypothetical protein